MIKQKEVSNIKWDMGYYLFILINILTPHECNGLTSGAVSDLKSKHGSFRSHHIV